ncbi:hypothetical protein B0H13DRAFT_2212655 [Mycena leptocephala]|nr:hypothetical protein B0H13DRAFT_2212655 [Mycena leptocephala]
MSTAIPEDSAEPCSTRLDEIHQAIAWHHTQIAILKAEANSLCPVLNLPTEIISKIFVSYAHESGPTFDFGWSKVMFVCRRWYEIALSEQQLWGFIEISSSKKIAHLDVLLQRSGVAPLNIKITWLDVQIPPSLLLQHSDRLRDLDLAGPAVDIREFSALIPSHTFPILRSLKFHPRTWDSAPGEPPNTLPDGVFDGRAPCLTILELSYIYINWNRIHGLTILCLTSVRNTHPPTEGALLSMLEASPALTYLKLSFMVSEISTPLWSYPVVSLPLLEFFCIQDQAACCNRLLRHVTVPPSARLSVLGWDIGGGREIVDLLVPLRRHLRDPSAPAVRYLRLECMSTPEMGPIFTVSTSTAVPQPDNGRGEFAHAKNHRKPSKLGKTNKVSRI